jgi:hypothetical protein
MAKNKKKPAKKKASKAKAKAKAKSAVKKAAEKRTTRKAAKKVAKKPATRKAAKKTTKKPAKKRSAGAPKAVQKKPVVMTVPAGSSKPAAPAFDKKSVKPFVDEEPQKSLFSQPMGSAMPKDSDLDEELGEDDVDIVVEADEDVEEELNLGAEDEDADFPEKREGLLDDADDYHTH